MKHHEPHWVVQTDQYHPVIYHSELENPEKMEVLMGNSSVNKPLSIAMINNRKRLGASCAGHRWGRARHGPGARPKQKLKRELHRVTTCFPEDFALITLFYCPVGCCSNMVI